MRRINQSEVGREELPWKSSFIIMRKINQSEFGRGVRMALIRSGNQRENYWRFKMGLARKLEYFNLMTAI